MWDRMAAWWDEKQGEEGDRWHRLLIEPPFERVIGDVGGLRVLEVACGNGRLARRMARGGATVTAVDASEGMILRARQSWVAERYAYETRVFRKVGRYREIFEHSAGWRVGGHQDPQRVMKTPHYHRPHSWYFRAIRTAGLAVIAFEEPEPTEGFVAESSQGPYLRKIPLHCVIEARKLGA
jgi:SAM-dependent methyltransferase